VAGGLVLFLLMPPEIGKIKSEASSVRTLEILGKRISVGEISSDALALSIKKERSLRRLLLIIGAVLYAVGITVSLIHLLNINNYSSPNDPVFDPNGEVITSALVISLSLLVPIVYTVICIFVFENSRKMEISYIKEALKEPRKEAEPCCENLFTKVTSFFKKNEKTVILTLRISLISLSVLFIVLGAFNGSLSAVMQKAIKICKECIGMG
jgi:phosphotransferase system  glucose/maltose/N-acetylglucosamine-specific IIC component